MSDEDRALWDEKWQAFDRSSHVSDLLVKHARLFTGGIALDVACGRGQNSMWLAKRGYQVLGVDLSPVGLAHAWATAAAEGLQSRILFVRADLDDWRPMSNSVELLCVMRFLDRDLIPALRQAVRPGGLVAYMTRHVGVLRRHPDANVEYLLRPGELPALFAEWEVLAHEVGDENAGLIARKPFL